MAKLAKEQGGFKINSELFRRHCKQKSQKNNHMWSPGKTTGIIKRIAVEGFEARSKQRRQRLKHAGHSPD
jgi:hypothetical protein